MSMYFITFRSVTLAQRGERILKKGNIRSQLQRTPRWMEEQGCGYCLRLHEDAVERAVQLFQGNGVQFRKVYLQRPDGNVEEMKI